MLFSRNILPSCSHCRFGIFIGGGEVACVRRGIVSAVSYCRQYYYDPLKRVPDDQPELGLSTLAVNFPEELSAGPENLSADPEAERETRLEAEINARLNKELGTDLDADFWQE